MINDELKIDILLARTAGASVDRYLAHLAELMTLKLDMERRKLSDREAYWHHEVESSKKEIVLLKKKLLELEKHPQSNQQCATHPTKNLMITPALPVGWFKLDQFGKRLPANAEKWFAVLDEKRGLMWAVNPKKNNSFPPFHQEINWHEAVKLARRLNSETWCGFCNWRLPSVAELMYLFVISNANELAIDRSLFVDIGDILNYWVWTSECIGNDPDLFATAVNFSVNRGVSHKFNFQKRIFNYVRLVRDV